MLGLILALYSTKLWGVTQYDNDAGGHAKVE